MNALVLKGLKQLGDWSVGWDPTPEATGYGRRYFDSHGNDFGPAKFGPDTNLNMAALKGNPGEYFMLVVPMKDAEQGKPSAAKLTVTPEKIATFEILSEAEAAELKMADEAPASPPPTNQPAPTVPPATQPPTTSPANTGTPTVVNQPQPTNQGPAAPTATQPPTTQPNVGTTAPAPTNPPQAQTPPAPATPPLGSDLNAFMRKLHDMHLTMGDGLGVVATVANNVGAQVVTGLNTLNTSMTTGHAQILDAIRQIRPSAPTQGTPAPTVPPATQPPTAPPINQPPTNQGQPTGNQPPADRKGWVYWIVIGVLAALALAALAFWGYPYLSKHLPHTAPDITANTTNGSTGNALPIPSGFSPVISNNSNCNIQVVSCSGGTPPNITITPVLPMNPPPSTVVTTPAPNVYVNITNTYMYPTLPTMQPQASEAPAAQQAPTAQAPTPPAPTQAQTTSNWAPQSSAEQVPWLENLPASQGELVVNGPRPEANGDWCSGYYIGSSGRWYWTDTQGVFHPFRTNHRREELGYGQCRQPEVRRVETRTKQVNLIVWKSRTEVRRESPPQPCPPPRCAPYGYRP